MSFKKIARQPAESGPTFANACKVDVAQCKSDDTQHQGRPDNPSELSLVLLK